MRVKIVIAILFFVSIIGIASWYRYSNNTEALPILVAESGPTITTDYKNILENYIRQRSATSTQEVALSGTDLISHQLIVDYVKLATSGNATSESIDALAEQYVEKVPYLNNVAEISLKEIETVPALKINYQNYANNLIKIEKTYKETIASAYTDTKSLSVPGPELYNFSRVSGTAFEKAASDLIKLEVPVPLADLHRQLINIYRNNAAALLSISNTEQDAASSFAGIIVLNNNLDKAEKVLLEIIKIMNENGI